VPADGFPPPPPPTPTPGEVEALVRALIGMMGSGGMCELDLSFGDVSVRLRGSGIVAPAAAPVASLPEEEEPEAIGGVLLTAPMIGTYYASPSPGAPAFVEIGDVVEAGQVIGIIEAMKIMNEIPAERGGVVAEVLVANGQPVEYGSPLLRLRA
jgi:acetyl-CoA carboxylase biotin carboxyl carrier protein